MKWLVVHVTRLRDATEVGVSHDDKKAKRGSSMWKLLTALSDDLMG